MSKQRITYVPYRYAENSTISLSAYTSEKTGAKYRIIIDYKEMVYKIRNERNKEFVFKSKSYGNRNVLLRSARAKLEYFGVNLKKEVRNRTFGRCPKGMTQEKWEMGATNYEA